MGGRKYSLESMGINLDKNFWAGKKVFLTGHTGFKGGWLALLLNHLDAKVFGYSLEPPTNPSFFDTTSLNNNLNYSFIGDILDKESLKQNIENFNPQVVIHLAAQSLVRESYINPEETFNTNIMGTLNVLECSRNLPELETILVITSDKCYENNSSGKPFKETHKLGGFDPYSSSKACAEILVNSYYKSFFMQKEIPVMTARAGNVIGGGDWAKDRLIPDVYRSILSNKSILLRYPKAVRPWQHVLEPVTGYLLLIEKRLKTINKNFPNAWNFGPDPESEKTVLWIVDELKKYHPNINYQIEDREDPHESNYLRLDSSQANKRISWIPKWNIERAIQETAIWFDYWMNGEEMATITKNQIIKYLNDS